MFLAVLLLPSLLLAKVDVVVATVLAWVFASLLLTHTHTHTSTRTVRSTVYANTCALYRERSVYKGYLIRRRLLTCASPNAKAKTKTYLRED